VNSQVHDPTALPLGKVRPISIGLEAGWVPEPVWTLWRREEFLSQLGIEHRSSSPYSCMV